MGMSRQNYYARRRQRQRREVDGELVAGLVKRAGVKGAAPAAAAAEGTAAAA